MSQDDSNYDFDNVLMEHEWYTIYNSRTDSTVYAMCSPHSSTRLVWSGNETKVWHRDDLLHSIVQQHWDEVVDPAVQLVPCAVAPVDSGNTQFVHKFIPDYFSAMPMESVFWKEEDDSLYNLSP